MKIKFITKHYLNVDQINKKHRLFDDINIKQYHKEEIDKAIDFVLKDYTNDNEFQKEEYAEVELYDIVSKMFYYLDKQNILIMNCLENNSFSISIQAKIYQWFLKYCIDFNYDMIIYSKEYTALSYIRYFKYLKNEFDAEVDINGIINVLNSDGKFVEQSSEAQDLVSEFFFPDLEILTKMI